MAEPASHFSQSSRPGTAIQEPAVPQQENSVSTFVLIEPAFSSNQLGVVIFFRSVNIAGSTVPVLVVAIVFSEGSN